MKLEVGMYVRTKKLLYNDYVIITKIKHIEEKENCLHIWLEDKDLITEKYIIKASHNIIDLIEVGDYVNGEKVGEVIRKEMYHFGDGIIIKNEDDKDIYSNFRYSKYANVETIVTKEQFESIKYSLEG